MSTSIDVLYVLSHVPDNRYKKRFEALKGIKQAVIFWNKSPESGPWEIPIDYLPLNIEANQTNPLKRIPETIRFIRAAKKEIEKLHPKVLYVGNLDMLYIAYEYKKRNPDVKIVYEVADLHRLIVDHQSGAKALVRLALRSLEKRALGSVDLLVVTSMKFIDVYYSALINKDKTLLLPNMPIIDAFADYDPSVHPRDFTVGFIGWIRYVDQLDMLVGSARKAGIKLLIAGSDNSGNDFYGKISGNPDIECMRSFDYEKDIAGLYESVDCVYCVYDADQFNVRVALPNKLYESIYCERPIIVAKGTYLSELVSDMGTGFSVSHNNESDLVELFNTLKNHPEIYEAAVESCRKHRALINPEEADARLRNRIRSFLA